MESRGHPSVKPARVCYRTRMASPPLIGVSTSVARGADGERAVLNATYLTAVQRAGGAPILLPPQLEGEARRAVFEQLGGVLLTGGGDVNPALFGEARHATVSGVWDERDRLEQALVEWALEHRRPLLAICRGVQVLNVALGGSLYQDIRSQTRSRVQHAQKAPRGEPTHSVRIEPGSRLAEVLGATELRVNSFHHQAIKEIGRGLKAVAFVEDDAIEGAELPDPSRFVLGVQWHPEELEAHDKPAQRLFRALIEACGS